MIIECSSNIFHVAQPSGYGREYTWEEDQANEDYQRILDERIQEKFQMYFNFKGLKNYKGTRRRNLPDWHPDRVQVGYYEVSGRRYLEKIIAPAWMAVLSERFAKRAGSNITVSLELIGVDSPKYYNYITDAALFRIHISAEDVQKIRQQVFAYPDVFEAYLMEYRKSCSGFISHAPYHSLENWEEYFASEPIPWREEPPYFGDWEIALWCLLEFWLFAFSADNPAQPPCLKALEINLDMFGEAFEWRIDKVRNELDHSDYMRFIPENSEKMSCI
jgi:hypothetical protein